jgi:hypothetical protein
VGADPAAHLEAEPERTRIPASRDHCRRHLGSPVRQHHVVHPALTGQNEYTHRGDHPDPQGGWQCRTHQAAECHRDRADSDTPGEETGGEVGA